MAGNSSQSHKVHWEKDAEQRNKGQPEMDVAQSRIHHTAKHLWEPLVHPSKESKGGGTSHYQVEVSCNKVGIMKWDIQGSVSEVDTGDSSNDKEGNQSNRK